MEDPKSIVSFVPPSLVRKGDFHILEVFFTPLLLLAHPTRMALGSVTHSPPRSKDKKGFLVVGRHAYGKKIRRAAAKAPVICGTDITRKRGEGGTLICGVVPTHNPNPRREERRIEDPDSPGKKGEGGSGGAKKRIVSHFLLLSFLSSPHPLHTPFCLPYNNTSSPSLLLLFSGAAPHEVYQLRSFLLLLSHYLGYIFGGEGVEKERGMMGRRRIELRELSRQTRLGRTREV